MNTSNQNIRTHILQMIKQCSSFSNLEESNSVGYAGLNQDELKELLDTNVDAARGKLLDEMCNYQGMKGMELIVVFDAYRVKGHETEITDYLNIHVVYTKEAETADQYIEKFAHTHGRKYDVTVATSDGLEQIIIRGQGCRLLSARELKRDYEEAKAQIRTEYLDKQKHEKSYVTDGISLEDTMNEN